jgi:hypothetical protein
MIYGVYFHWKGQSGGAALGMVEGRIHSYSLIKQSVRSLSMKVGGLE